jgi:hypothetical protein
MAQFAATVARPVLGDDSVLLTALGWLGWQVAAARPEHRAQLVNDRVNTAADLIAAQIRQNLIDNRSRTRSFCRCYRRTTSSAARRITRTR